MGFSNYMNYELVNINHLKYLCFLKILFTRKFGNNIKIIFNEEGGKLNEKIYFSDEKY